MIIESAGVTASIGRSSGESAVLAGEHALYGATQRPRGEQQQGDEDEKLRRTVLPHG
jgi:hypothetical protein